MTNTTQTTKRVSPRKANAVLVEEKKQPRRAVTSRKTDNQPTHSVIQRVAGTVVKFFVFVDGARPTSGNRLSAHTDAALRFLGLLDNGQARKAAAVTVMGSRTVKYHIECGNFVEEADKVALSKHGMAVFRERVEVGRVDTHLAKAFLSAIQKGKTNAEAGIKDNHLVPVSMPLL